MERAGAYRALPFARMVLFVSALAFLGIGAPFLVAPVEMTGFVGVSLAGATADNDVRAVYGGLQIACGLILLVCASRAAWLRLGLMTQLVLFAGLAGGRFVSWTVAGMPGPVGLGLHAAELVALAFGLVALWRLPARTRSA
jgi:hypothetical protein